MAQNLSERYPELKVPFSSLFKSHENGDVEALQDLKMGKYIYPRGFLFKKWDRLIKGVIKINDYIGHDLVVINKDGLPTITGYY